MDGAVRVILIDAAGCTHAHGGHAIAIRLDKTGQGLDRFVCRSKIGRQAAALADGKILAQHGPLNCRAAHVDAKILFHAASASAPIRQYRQTIPSMQTQRIPDKAKYLVNGRF